MAKFSVGSRVMNVGYTLSRYVRDGDIGRVASVDLATDPVLDDMYHVTFETGSGADGSTYCIPGKLLTSAREPLPPVQAPMVTSPATDAAEVAPTAEVAPAIAAPTDETETPTNE